ncbi:ABC transporter ATP-binding protein/permease, partial [Prochlorococcus sp. AH-716-M18]|nr:ABC transporter ATP-binding protein/permease [Prochlorococcus sp. AH-716-M18]
LNIKQIKLFNAYKFPLEKIDYDLKRYGKVRVAFGVSKGIPSPFFRYLFISGGVITLMIISSSDKTELTNFLPNVTLLALLAGRLSAVFSTLSKQTMKFNQGLANVESVYKRIFGNNEIEDLDNGLNINQKINKIDFKNVSFSWTNKNMLFKDLNICFERGVNVITGASGCGKSTIASLLLSLLKVDSGEIRINGKNINIFNKNSLRSKIAYITQDYELFQVTFLENIKLGNPIANREEVIKAGKLSLSHEFIMSTENGYETQLTERGGTLSGGQKQRLSIARGLLKKHDVYIFDEATNALDANNESLIQNTISELGKNSIVIQISHLPNSHVLIFDSLTLFL